MTDKEISQQAKEYLMQISKTDRLIKRLTETVSTLRSSLTSGNYELKQDVVQTSGPKNALENTMLKIVDLEKQIDDRIDELVSMKADAEKRVRALPDLDQQTVLLARYVQGLKWDRISLELNFSISQVYKLHGQALLNFGNNMESV